MHTQMEMTEMQEELDIEIAFDAEDDLADEETPEELAPPITMIELAAIKRDRERLDALRADAEALTLELRAREQGVIQRMEAGAPVDGSAVVVERRRQSISWLTVVARELGHDAIERVKSAWPTVYWKELHIA